MICKREKERRIVRRPISTFCNYVSITSLKIVAPSAHAQSISRMATGRPCFAVTPQKRRRFTILFVAIAGCSRKIQGLFGKFARFFVGDLDKQRNALCAFRSIARGDHRGGHSQLCVRRVLSCWEHIYAPRKNGCVASSDTKVVKRGGTYIGRYAVCV